MDQAAEQMVWLSQELDDKFAFIACDEGNKSNVNHLVKHISWLDDDGNARVHLLDIDGSEGTAVAVAEAMQHSLKKLGLGGHTICLKGQSTDSGGGGVLDGLARELKKLDLTHEVCIVAACAIHCLQLQLSKPTKELIGDGGPDKRNAMQLLHCIYDLQKYIEWPQVVAMMDHCQEWVDSHLDGYSPPTDATRGDHEFAVVFNKVRQFRVFGKMGKQHWRASLRCLCTHKMAMRWSRGSVWIRTLPCIAQV